MAAEEEEAEEEQPDDETLHREREAAHLQIIQDKEWRDASSETIEVARARFRFVLRNKTSLT